MATLHPLHPLDLPEIRYLISQFVTKKCILRCMLVCKSWHASFLPALWHTFDPVNLHQPAYSSIETIKKYKHLVKSINVQFGLFGDQGALLQFPKLESAQVKNSGILQLLVDQHPNLKNISLSFGSGDPKPSDRLWASIDQQLKYLTSLRLHEIFVPQSEVPAFWNVCSRLVSLTLSKSTIRSTIEMTLQSPRCFHQLQDLSIIEEECLSHEEQLMLITRAPQLRTLRWRLHSLQDSTSSSLDEFLQRVVSKTTWPQIETIDLDIIHKTKAYRSNIKAGLISTSNQVPVNPFELSLSWNATGVLEDFPLIPRQDFITVLDFSNRTSFNHFYHALKAPARSILASCSQLVEFHAGHVDAQEIVDGAWENAWACKGTLKKLHMAFIMRNKESTKEQLQENHECVFKMLSELNNLELLDVGASRWGELESMGFQMQLGLGQLATLSKLTELVLNTRQSMGQAEVEWMIRSWKNLESIQGSLTWEEDHEDKLVAQLREANIQVEC